MPVSNLIATYLSALEHELRVSPRRRHRILLEIEDHLHDVTLRLELEGLTPEEAQRTAIVRFGTSQEIARQFAVASGTDQACKASAASVAAVGVILVVLQVQDSVLAAHPPRWLNSTPPLSIGLVAFGIALGALFGALAIGCVALWQTRQVRRSAAILSRSKVRRILSMSVCSLFALLVSSVADMVYLIHRADLVAGGTSAGTIALLVVLQAAAIGIGGSLVGAAVSRFGALGSYQATYS